MPVKSSNLLIQEAFEKAEGVTGKDSVNGRAEYLSEYILQQYKYSISSKSLSRYYKGESQPNLEVRNYLAGFLGFEDHEAFVVARRAPEEEVIKTKKATQKRPLAKGSLLLILLIIPVIGISAYVGYITGEEKCMVWAGDHYVQVACSGDEGEKALDPVQLENFIKIEVSDTTRFFEHGEAQVWYDKSNNQLEFFTAPGLHPRNGKTLKPVTKYIIKKYVE